MTWYDMLRHKVVSVHMDGPANGRDLAHVTRVGTASDGHQVDRFWDAAEVAAACDEGQVFFTRRPTTRSDGSVFVQRCRMCDRLVLRSGPDTEEYNRLDQHPRSD